MIYIVKHKMYHNPVPKGFQEIYVGDIYKGKCDYINSLNPYLNEVTALFDIWLLQDEIVGLVHYRRFFKDLTFDDAERILRDYDVITTTDYEPVTPYDHLMSLDKALVDKYLEQLPKDVQQWFHEHHAFNICNMFVARRDFYEKYCKWLFPMIYPFMEQFLKEDVTDDFRRNRTLGFICECLFGYYCKDFKRYKIPIQEI